MPPPRTAAISASVNHKKRDERKTRSKQHASHAGHHHGRHTHWAQHNQVEPLTEEQRRDRNNEAVGRAAMGRLSRAGTQININETLRAVKAQQQFSPRDGRIDSMHLMLNLTGGGVLMPMSSFMKRWEKVTVFLLLFTALVTPFEIAFLETNYDTLFVLNRLVDVGFLMDIAINFRLAYLDKKEGSFVLDEKKIVRHYLRGWFTLDAVSLIPWDLIELLSGSGGNLKVLRLLKILKLTKLVRILKSATLFKRIQADLGLDNTSSSLVKYLMMIVATMHWVACGWGMVAAFQVSEEISADAESAAHRLLKGSSAGGEGTDGPLDSWLLAYEHEHGGKISVQQQYGLCLEYSLSVMCMGYGNTLPVTVAELWFSLAMMLIAGSVYAFVIGGICGAVATEDPATAEFKMHMDALMRFFRETKLPEDLKMRALEYLNFTEVKLRAEANQTVLEIMPDSIRGEICTYQYAEIVHKIPFLVGCFEGKQQNPNQIALVAEICTRLIQEAYPPKELIYQLGAEADQMYIITRGVIKKQGGFEQRTTLLTAGDNFGTDMLLTPDARRWHTCSSVSYTCMSVLTADDLFSLQAEKYWLFDIASKTMRAYKNCLRCAYALQVFGSQIKREIKREINRAKDEKQTQAAAAAAAASSAALAAVDVEEQVYTHYRQQFSRGASWHRLKQLSSVAPWKGWGKGAPQDEEEVEEAGGGEEPQAEEVGQQLDSITFERLPLNGLLGLQHRVSGLQQRLSECIGAAAAAHGHTGKADTNGGTATPSPKAGGKRMLGSLPGLPEPRPQNTGDGPPLTLMPR